MRSVMAQGRLLPDGLMIRMVKKRLRKDRACRTHGWLLDGFPRTAAQAHAMLAAGLVPNRIIVLNASSSTVVARVVARAHAASERGETPRSDDSAETMRTRIAEYERNKAATLTALRGYLRVTSVDGEGTSDAVSTVIAKSLA